MSPSISPKDVYIKHPARPNYARESYASGGLDAVVPGRLGSQATTTSCGLRKVHSSCKNLSVEKQCLSKTFNIIVIMEHRGRYANLAGLTPTPPTIARRLYTRYRPEWGTHSV